MKAGAGSSTTGDLCEILGGYGLPIGGWRGMFDKTQLNVSHFPCFDFVALALLRVCFRRLAGCGGDVQ
jgi:hypothetical protein